MIIKPVKHYNYSTISLRTGHIKCEIQVGVFKTISDSDLMVSSTVRKSPLWILTNFSYKNKDQRKHKSNVMCFGTLVIIKSGPSKLVGAHPTWLENMNILYMITIQYTKLYAPSFIRVSKYETPLALENKLMFYVDKQLISQELIVNSNHKDLTLTKKRHMLRLLHYEID